MPNTKPTEETLFVRAVLRGVRRGLKLIRRRGRGYTRYYAPEGVLGEYDYTHIRLKLKPAYELYKELSAAPLMLRNAKVRPKSGQSRRARRRAQNARSAHGGIVSPLSVKGSQSGAQERSEGRLCVHDEI